MESKDRTWAEEELKKSPTELGEELDASMGKESVPLPHAENENSAGARLKKFVKTELEKDAEIRAGRAGSFAETALKGSDSDLWNDLMNAENVNKASSQETGADMTDRCVLDDPVQEWLVASRIFKIISMAWNKNRQDAESAGLDANKNLEDSDIVLGQFELDYLTRRGFSGKEHVGDIVTTVSKVINALEKKYHFSGAE